MGFSLTHSRWLLLTLSLTSLLCQADNSAAQLAYRNAVTPPPPDWNGPVFQLSDAYPTTPPATCDSQQCPWLGYPASLFQTTFGKDGVPQWDATWNSYIQSILSYIREGQSDDLNNAQGFNTQVDGKTRWYSVPWMAYDPTSGREFIHGLTNERTAVLSDFHGSRRNLHGLGANPHTLVGATDSQARFETWAVAYYNDVGAYSLGQAWDQQGNPRFGDYQGVPAQSGMPFATGTVVVKLLFSSASPKDVPYLHGSPQWQADRHVEKDNQFYCERQPQPVHLVQMDVAVVNPQSPTRWVFGTFAYNGDLGGKNVWENLSPVGLQWGMDPWTFPAVPKSASIRARQSVLNRDNLNVRAEHFGCEGRLAGPVDNKLSSCLSCHGGAYANKAGNSFFSGAFSPPIFGFDGLCEQYSQDNSNYFQTLTFPMQPAGGEYGQLLNLDTSLQLQIALQQWSYFQRDKVPQACVDPSS
ncbi:hypothetical protein [Pokkaliibacter plantistimulans]|uniref:hypothetical protein n=1 Tax=Pokkaliibacter plantistimulans TaxID=1635171 RepID=UPI001A9C37C0|nr:hypothetical protein [Pokkaliibacter plantistimulans]